MRKRFWPINEKVWLTVAILLMGVAAPIWLGYEGWRLLGQPSPLGAIDLGQRFNEVHQWFDGQGVYDLVGATYPPATYAILWPLVGWLDFTGTRWLWAATTVLVLAWLARLLLRESASQTQTERAFIVLLLLSTYGTGATIGNGQLILHLLPCLLTSLLLLERGSGTFPEDLAAAGLFVLALVKPSVTAPFFLIVLLRPHRLRPALLVAGGYLGLTLGVSAFRPNGPIELLRNWSASSRRTLAKGALEYSNSNLHSWAVSLGITDWYPAAAVLCLLGFSLWMYRHRFADVWVAIGVTALVARFYTYHGWYDDVLIVLPMLTLFRIAKTDEWSERAQWRAKLLLGLSFPIMIAPGGLYLLPTPWNSLFVVVQTCVWLLFLIFLANLARRNSQDKFRDTLEPAITADFPRDL